MDIAVVVEAVELIVSSPQGLLICLLIAIWFVWDLATRKDATIREQDERMEKYLLDEIKNLRERERRCQEQKKAEAERRDKDRDDAKTKTDNDGKPVPVADFDAHRVRKRDADKGGKQE